MNNIHSILICKKPLNSNFSSVLEDICSMHGSKKVKHDAKTVLILEIILMKMYFNPNIIKLIKTSKNYHTIEKFSVNMTKVFLEQGIDIIDCKILLDNIKKILQLVNVDNQFIDLVSFTNDTKFILRDLSKKYSIIPSIIHPEGKIVVKWIDLLRKSIYNTYHIRYTIFLIISILDDLKIYPSDTNKIKNLSYMEIQHLIDNPSMKDYFIKFYQVIFNIKVDIDRQEDVERLKHIYACVKENIMYKTIMLLLCTTNIGFTGISNIKLKDVLILDSGTLKVSGIGKTLGINKKWYIYTIFPGVKHVIAIWIKTYRKNTLCNHSLFPSFNIKKVVRNISSKSGVKKQYITHKFFRETFCYMMDKYNCTLENTIKILNNYSRPSPLVKNTTTCNINISRIPPKVIKKFKGSSLFTIPEEEDIDSEIIDN